MSVLLEARAERRIRPNPLGAKRSVAGRMLLSARRIPFNAMQPGETPGIEFCRGRQRKTQLRRELMVMARDLGVNTNVKDTHPS